jgi:predicted transcriptional regulator
VLEEKGHVHHEDDGQRYVYSPAAPRGTVRRSALKHLVETFYEGSVEQAVAALLGGDGARLTTEQLDRIEDLIRKARKEGSR